jgi:exopolysaccharide biosynthesis polyprenyl glycosylphosphotransferase
MISNVDNPDFQEVDNRASLAGSATLGTKHFSLKFEQLVTTAEVIGDFVAAAVGMIGAYGAYHMLGLGKGVLYPIPVIIWAALVFAFLFVVMLEREGVYRRGSGMLQIKETERILRVSVQSFLVIFTVTIFSAHLLPRGILGIGIVLLPITVVFEKQVLFSIVRYLHTRGRGVRKAIIYGSGYTGKRVYSVLLRSMKLGINPLVFVDDRKEKLGKAIYSLGYRRDHSAPVIRGPITSELIESYGADMVVVAIPSIRQEKLSAVANEAKRAGATLAFVPTRTMYEYDWIDYADIDGIILATVNPAERMYLYERLKRLSDVLLGVTALVVLSPLFALIALGIYLNSGGPIFFKQQRVGKDGQIFEMYKFRSMRVDAAKYEFSPTTVKDSRITRIGQILRKTSLDELPQLVNVILGDMSLVGPRPEMPFIVEKYGPQELQRLSVVPGITGMWQLSADRAYLIHENLQYDLYYIRHRGLFMDYAILIHTAIFAVKGV